VVDYIFDVNNQLAGKILDPDGDAEETASEEYYAYDNNNSPRPLAGEGQATMSPLLLGEGQGVRAAEILFRFAGPSAADMTDRYLWAPAVDLLLCDEKVSGPSTAGAIYWALGDNLNTVRDLARYDTGTDKTLIANHRRFDAFGNLTYQSAPAVSVLFAFTGRYFDPNTSMQNNLNRWYDGAVGRWMSEDPIGFRKRDRNLYGYVRNNPLTDQDPSGLEELCARTHGIRFVPGRGICFGDDAQGPTPGVHVCWTPPRPAPAPKRAVKCDRGIVAEIIAEAQRRRGTKAPGDDSAHHCWAVCAAGRISLLIGAQATALIGCVAEAIAPSPDWAEANRSHPGGVFLTN
jgi:RHS repeat-associated protein